MMRVLLFRGSLYHMHIDRGSNGLITILHLFAYYCVIYLILSPCVEMVK